MLSQRVYQIFNDKKELLFSIARRKLDRRMFSDIQVETFLDDIVMYTVLSKQNKKGFIDDIHIIKYLKHAISNRARIEFFMKRNKMLDECKMTDEERVSNYTLTLEIINKARPVKQ